jgi:hypothetical protein
LYNTQKMQAFRRRKPKGNLRFRGLDDGVKGERWHAVRAKPEKEGSKTPFLTLSTSPNQMLTVPLRLISFFNIDPYPRSATVT